MKSKNLLAGMSLTLVLGGTMLATGCTEDNLGSNIDLKQEVIDSTIDNLNTYLQDMKDSNKTNEEKLNNDSDYVKDTLLNLIFNQFVSSATQFSPMSYTIENKYYTFGVSEDEFYADDETSDSAKQASPLFVSLDSTTYKVIFEDNTLKFFIEDKYKDNEEGTNQIKRYYFEWGATRTNVLYRYEGYVDHDGVAQESKTFTRGDILDPLDSVADEYFSLLSKISCYNYFVRTVNGNETTYLCVNLDDFGISPSASDDLVWHNYLKIVLVDDKLDMVERCSYGKAYVGSFAVVETKKYDFENVVIDFDKTGYVDNTTYPQ